MIRKPLPIPQRWLYRAYYWLIAAPLIFLVLTPLAALSTFVVAFIKPRLASRIGVPWATSIAWLIPMKIRRHGFENIDPKQSYVVVANHQSQSDIIALYGALPIDFRWVMKKELRSFPLVGAACEKMGHVFVDRSNKEKAIASLNAAREQLVDGVSILFFPEGTRDNSPGLLPFKKGAFHMALDLQLPILPITLVGTGDVMPPKSLELQRPGTVDLYVHPAIPVEGLESGQVEELIEQVRQVMASRLEPPS